MAKSQLRWEYPPQEDLITIEVRDIYNQGDDTITHLRPCQYGINEQGEIVKRLYCTAGNAGKNPLFFAPKGYEWSERHPCFNKLRRKQAGKPLAPRGGGNADCPHVDDIDCHRLVAYAWCKHPKAAKKDPEWYKRGHGFECDHKNCDHGNFCAENLEWVTVKENQRRRHKVEEPLKKLGITKISRVRIPHLDCLYAFHEVQLDYFFERLPEFMAQSQDDLTIENINRVVAEALDDVHDLTITCSRCGKKMIVDTEESYTRYGILCDCCYGDLYG